MPGFTGLTVPRMAGAANFRFMATERVGEDLLVTARPLAVAAPAHPATAD